MNTLTQYGFTDRIDGLFTAHFPPRSGARAARVIRTDRGRVLLASHDGLVHLDSDGALVTGDWVAVAGGNPATGGDRVLRLLPRFSLLRRKRAHDPLSEAQLLGANMDLVGVVVPLDRRLSTNRLERTLGAARDSGALPVVILTKADLSTRFDDVVAETIDRARGVEVITTSAEASDGLDELRGRIGPGQTTALLGPSGAGKSSLVNALTGSSRQGTGPVRAGDGKGRHTTTARELVPLGDGAVVMDTPGLRGFALWDAEDGLANVFTDVEELVTGCRFSDCAHDRAARSGRPSRPARWRSGAGRVTGRWSANSRASTVGRRRRTSDATSDPSGRCGIRLQRRTTGTGSEKAGEDLGFRPARRAKRSGLVHLGVLRPEVLREDREIPRAGRTAPRCHLRKVHDEPVPALGEVDGAARRRRISQDRIGLVAGLGGIEVEDLDRLGAFDRIRGNLSVHADDRRGIRRLIQAVQLRVDRPTSALQRVVLGQVVPASPHAAGRRDPRQECGHAENSGESTSWRHCLPPFDRYPGHRRMGAPEGEEGPVNALSGAGRCSPKPGAIAKAVRKVLSDPSYRQAAGRLAFELALYDALPMIARELGRHVSATRAQHDKDSGGGQRRRGRKSDRVVLLRSEFLTARNLRT